MRPDVAAWLARARADADARGLAPLAPLLDALARSTSALRDAAIASAEGPAGEDADAPAEATAPASESAALPKTPDATDAAE